MIQRSILFVITSHATLGDTGTPTGGWLEELAVPYWRFAGSGFECAIASPQGGRAPLDPASLAEPWLSADGKRFLDDRAAVEKLERSLAVSSVDPASETLAAIFLVGGAGAMWDFPDSAPLGKLVSEMAALDKPVGAICHGVAGLLAARTSSGRPFVENRSVTSFSNEEERALGLEEVVPFLLESALLDNGGIYTCAASFEAHVTTAGPLVTGQNPASAAPMADTMLAQLNSAGLA